MADAHKFTSLQDAVKVFPDLPWQANDETTWVFDEKAGEYVTVTKGQFIYKVGERFEVRDVEELPKTAKPVTETDAKVIEKAQEDK